MKLPISLLILAKNEEKTIRFCIAPFKQIVQEIIVCDTGSTDRTVSIARSLGAKIIRMRLNDDFSAVRNVMIEKASGSWLLKMDADSRIAFRDVGRLRFLINQKKVQAYLFPIRNYTSDFNLLNSWQTCKNQYPEEERFSKMSGYYLSSGIWLFKKDPRLKYVFPVHESVQPAIATHHLCLGQAQIPIHHFEFNKGVRWHREKHLFYLRLERKTIRHWPKEPAVYANLIRDILFTNSPLTEAELAAKKLTRLAPRNAGHWFLRALVAMCLKKWPDAYDFISESIKIRPTGDNLCLKGWIELKRNNLEKAKTFLLRVVRKKKDHPLALNLLGVLSERSGKPLKADHYFARALKLLPSYKDALFNRAVVHKQIKKRSLFR